MVETKNPVERWPLVDDRLYMYADELMYPFSAKARAKVYKLQCMYVLHFRPLS